MYGHQATDLKEGAVCSLTKRIMIISPMPDRVRSLLVMLTAECFDVFSLHDFNRGMLPALQPELLIYDALPIVHKAADHTLRNGAELLQAAEEYNVPVLMLLDKPTYDERGDAVISGVEGFVWPANPEEALQRIKRMLERRDVSQSLFSGENRVMFKDIEIDLRKMKVLQNNVRVHLTKTEYDLLQHFVTSDGSVMSRELLLDSVWGLQFYGSSNVVDVHIKSLRKKLRDSAVSPKYIVTVRGAGYRLADDYTH